uniref:Uncharacterized protein n=1 Tax=Daphnia magna TaxID=35525 RepID=A0A0N8EMJ2_9CRUS
MQLESICRIRILCVQLGRGVSCIDFEGEFCFVSFLSQHFQLQQKRFVCCPFLGFSINIKTLNLRFWLSFLLVPESFPPHDPTIKRNKAPNKISFYFWGRMVFFLPGVMGL